MPSPSTALTQDFYERPVADVARDLIGCRIVRTLSGNKKLEGRIVETEAYDEGDAASHSFRGQTPRNSVMFGPPGRLYVYRIYGIHWCMNISTGPAGFGAAVLLRAIQPLRGLEAMRARRGNGTADVDLARGPGRLTQALIVDDSLQGHRLERHPLRVYGRDGSPGSIIQTIRIGITKEVERPWRFCLAGSRWVSGPKRLRG